ncbi:MAG: PAS domain-containing protein [Terrimicrobiaceae bacterium]
MIALMPNFNEEGKSSSPKIPEAGMERLLEDLVMQTREENICVPETLKRRVFERIDQEPARVETDLHGCIEAINPAFSGLCGYSFPEIQGRKPGTFLQGPETDAVAVQTLRDAIAALCPVEVTLTNYHKNGSPYKVWIAITPRRDADGNAVGFTAVEKKL